MFSLRLGQTTNNYMSCKYGISQDVITYQDVIRYQLAQKVDMKCHVEFRHRNAVQTVVELCTIRDGVVGCDILSLLE